MLKETNRQTLNKSKILNHLCLSVLMFSLLFVSVYLNRALAKDSTDLQIQILPNEPKQGDTVSVKVHKLKDVTSPPKIFFDKTKLPVFKINDTWYRVLIPLVANQELKDYTIEVYYGKGKKHIGLTVKDGKYKVEELTLSKQASSLQTTKIERTSVRKAVNTVSSNKYWQGKFSYPSKGPLSTEYGIKRKINGVFNPNYFHKGLDFAVPEGSIVKAPERGKILLAGLTKKGFVVNGNCVFIDHGHGVVSAYLHLSEVLVKEGDIVKKGDLIGKVGSTGIATGPHLHWGLYVTGKAVKPGQWVQTAIE